MINIKVNKGKVETKINGSLAEITADCCVALRSVWNALREDDKYAGKNFERYFRSEINDIFSENDELKERYKDLIKEREDKLNEIMTMLDELLDSQR